MTDLNQIKPVSHRVRLLTFNTMGAPLKPNRRARFHRIGELMIRYGREHHVDVITLQETFDHALRDELLIGPWKNFFSFFAHSHEKDGRYGCAGLTTLSRHTIMQSEFCAFKDGTGVDYFVNKGVLHTRVHVHGHLEVDVYNTHPQASYISQRRRSAVRIRQIGCLLNFAAATNDGVRPIVLTGDLNIEEYNEEYKLITEAGYVDVMRALHPDALMRPMKTLRKSDVHKERKLDHVFLRIGSKYDWIKEDSQTDIHDFGLSDHRAVLTEIALKRLGI